MMPGYCFVERRRFQVPAGPTGANRGAVIGSYAVRMRDSPLSPQEIRAVVRAVGTDWAGRHRGGRASVRTGPRVSQG
jgi:hypothetical protein